MARTVVNVMSGPNGPRLKQLRKNNPNMAKRAIQNIMSNPNKSVNNVIRNAAANQVNAVVNSAKAAVQANKNAQQAAKQAVNAKNNAAANTAARQANNSANNAANAAKNAQQAQRQVQRNPNVPANAKNVANNAANAANNNARQANIAANIAATAAVPAPPPPPPPPAKQNQNGEPKGDGVYMDEAKKLWKEIDRMINRADQTNVKSNSAAKVVDSLRKNLSKLSKDFLGVNERFKKEVNSLLGEYPELQDTYKHLANCETNTNNKSGGCPKLRNMDKYIGEIKAAIGRKKNSNKLIKQAKNVNERQKLQEQSNKKAKNEEILVAQRKALRINVNGLVKNLKNLQNKI